MLKTLEYRGGPKDGETFHGEWDVKAWALTGDNPGEDQRKHIYTLRRDEHGNEWLQYEGEAE